MIRFVTIWLSWQDFDRQSYQHLYPIWFATELEGSTEMSI